MSLCSRMLKLIEKKSSFQVSSELHISYFNFDKASISVPVASQVGQRLIKSKIYELLPNTLKLIEEKRGSWFLYS